MKKEISIESSNKSDKLHVVIWEPEVEVKGIVQISHGMVEYVERFENLAKVLNDAGWLCIGNDHLGHGKTAANKEDLGYFGKGKSGLVVDDLHLVTEYAKECYGKNVPYVLFGHSMGSFMARRYLCTYGSELNGAIISGTGYTPNAILGAGKMVAGIVRTIKGERYRSKLLENMAFGAYNKKITDAKTDKDWLTKDEQIVKKYLADEFCTFAFTVNGYETLFDVLSYIQSDENVGRIPKNLPIYMISGDMDPVGDYGKGVETVYNQFKRAAIENVVMKLYEGDRHELTNELDKEQVYADILSWLKDNFGMA